MSDTHRTDAETGDMDGNGDFYRTGWGSYVPVHFARTLELELAAANRALSEERTVANGACERAEAHAQHAKELIIENARLRDYAATATEALERIAANGPYAVNGGHACATCHAFWHADPVITKFQDEHHMDSCAYVIARDALAKNQTPATLTGATSEAATAPQASERTETVHDSYAQGIEDAAALIESMDVTEPALFAQGRGNIAALIRKLAAQRVRECHQSGQKFEPGRYCLNPSHCAERGECRSTNPAACHQVRTPSMTTQELRGWLAPATGGCEQQIVRLLAHLDVLEGRAP